MYQTHSWNWEREFENNNLSYVYAKELLTWLDGLDMLRLEAIATGGKLKLSGNLSFAKTTLFG
jgi:hypothetical protein